ncbi:NAD(P)-dependent oxidoreductase [Halobacillus litoralis]|uniref:NAD(P)-dependent oxidoreductase n=1 Tax=Halobacillus litoralis TaxID=45668 RepID=UPI001CFD2745|nr:NAD(P)H-binding protein [Halobacillus litoralis]
MKIAVLGGTGRVGSKVIQQAIDQQIKVKALVRDKDKADALIPKAEHVVGDVRKEEDIQTVLHDCDYVFSSLSTDKTDTLSQSTPLVIKEMNKQGLKRIVTIGTAGILNSRYEKGKYRFETSESKRSKTFAAEEHAKVYEMFRDSSLDWTIICPTYLPDGHKQGDVRYEMDLLPEGGKKITVDDTAQFAFHALMENKFLYHRVGICY